MSLSLSVRLSLDLSLGLRGGVLLAALLGRGGRLCADAGSSVLGLGLARTLGTLGVALDDARVSSRVATVEDGVASLHGKRMLGHGGEVETIDAGFSGGAGGDQRKGSGDKREELHCCESIEEGENAMRCEMRVYERTCVVRASKEQQRDRERRRGRKVVERGRYEGVGERKGPF